jgi:hypothetical protein
MENIILPELGKRKYVSITDDDIEALKAKLSDRKVTFNRTLAVLSKAFSLVRMKMPGRLNPCRIDGIRYKETPVDRPIQPWEMQGIARALIAAEEANNTEQSGYLLVVKLLMMTGCRVGEFD